MFGLMKACSCQGSATEREQHRLHYCGTCKSIGRLYGQKARLFLNHDIVFLNELLTDLQPRQTTFASAYVSRNCMMLPAAREIPWTMEYAAATNVLLAQFKLLDHAKDTGSRVVQLATKTFTREFESARKTLARLRFPTEEVHRLINLQPLREAEAHPGLERLTEPTSVASSRVFEHGALLAGTSLESVQLMSGLGNTFGEIAYLADAITDRDSDREKHQFNALDATQVQPSDALEILSVKRDTMLAQIGDLPIERSRQVQYSSRLRHSLAPYFSVHQRPPNRNTRTTSRKGSPYDPNEPSMRTIWCMDCGSECCCDLAQCACCECASGGCCDCAASGCCDCAGGCCVLN